jgi:sensor c-di-GMP phosphodiesterase-like protein
MGKNLIAIAGFIADSSALSRLASEGVENENILDILERMGCDRAQGFFIGEAVPAKKLEALVEKWNSRFMRPALTEVG